MDDRKKKFGIIAASSIVLVAMVIILVVACTGSNNKKSSEVSASQRAIMTICDTTDYKQTCLDSLAGHNSSDPKELIKVAIQASINHIKEAIKKSMIIRDAEKEPRGISALETCHDLANRSIDDLQRSYTKFTNFDITGAVDIPLDLKIWLSGAITHQETCLDSFEDVPGDVGQKMREVLKTSMEMTSNALTMVAEISTFLDSMGAQSATNRRLLTMGELPEWIDSSRRKLLAASPQVVTPDIIVAKDGTGNYLTINEALKNIPKNGNKTFVLYIKEGVYEEKVQVNSSMKHLFVIGDGPLKTRITGKLNFFDGTNTYQTATVAVKGDDFIARDIGFENIAGPEKHQAVALRVSADKAIFYNCHMDAYQDTLYAHSYRQFYRNCLISGTIDFIFGDSATIFQNCTISVRKPLENQECVVTAQGRKEIHQPTGFILQNCSIKADKDLHTVRKNIMTYLGRPWKKYSRTVIMESFLDDVISPMGWLPWNGTFALGTLFYTEFNNRGPAAPKKQRVKWPGVKELSSSRIQRFTAVEFLDGNGWIPQTQVPYKPGFIFPMPKDDPNVMYSPIVPEETKDLGSKIEQAKYFSPPKDRKQNVSPFTNTNGGQSPKANTGGSSTTAMTSSTTLVPRSNSTPPPPVIFPTASTVVIIETNVTALKASKAAPPKSSVSSTNACRVSNGGNLASVHMHPPISLNGSSNLRALTNSTVSSTTSSGLLLDSTTIASSNFEPDVATAHSPKENIVRTNLSASAPNVAFDESKLHKVSLGNGSTSTSQSTVGASSPKLGHGSSDLSGVASAPTTSFGGSAPPPHQEGEATLPLTASSGGSVTLTPPPKAYKSAPNKYFASPPSQIDVNAPPPTSISGRSSSSPPHTDVTTSPPRRRSATTSPPLDSATSPSQDNISTSPPPPPPSSVNRSSSQAPPKGHATPPISSSSDGSTPSSPESDTTATPPTSQISGSAQSPPPSKAAVQPPTPQNGGSVPSPPQSESTTPPPNSQNGGSVPSTPQSLPTTSPPSSQTGGFAPSPPQSEATIPPSSSLTIGSTPSRSQSKATTPPTSQDGDAVKAPPQSEARSPPSTSQDGSSVPSPPQSDASSPSPTTPSIDTTQSPPPPHTINLLPISQVDSSVSSHPVSDTTIVLSSSQSGDSIRSPPSLASQSGGNSTQSPPKSDKSPPTSRIGGTSVHSPPQSDLSLPPLTSQSGSDSSPPPPQSDISPPPTSSSGSSVQSPPQSDTTTLSAVNSINTMEIIT